MHFVFSILWIFPSLKIHNFFLFSSQSTYIYSEYIQNIFSMKNKTFSFGNFYHNNFCSQWEITSWADKHHNWVEFMYHSSGIWITMEVGWRAFLKLERAHLNFLFLIITWIWFNSINLQSLICVAGWALGQKSLDPVNSSRRKKKQVSNIRKEIKKKSKE